MKLNDICKRLIKVSVKVSADLEQGRMLPWRGLSKFVSRSAVTLIKVAPDLG